MPVVFATSPLSRLRRRLARAGAGLFLGVALLMLLWVGLSLEGAEAPAAQPPLDPRLTLQLRALLAQDPRLNSLNLFVTVRRNVATLAGDVPSEALVRHAGELAVRVLGIAEVRNELRVAPRDGRPEPPTAFPDPPRALVRQEPRKEEYADPMPPRKEERPPVLLLEPVPIVVGPAVPAPTASLGATIPKGVGSPRPAVPTGQTLTLAESVEAVRSKDPRFRGLRPEVRQGEVSIRGVVALWSDADAFTDLVRRLPGVRRVVVDQVRLDPSLPR